MRALDRLISFIFSIIMLVVSIILILVGVGVVEPQMILDMLKQYVFVEEMIATNIFNTITIVGIVLFLASLKTTIFLSLFKTKDKAPILVKTKNGEVEIAQETITNTVKSIGMSFENMKDVQAKMIKKRRGVVIYAMILLYSNSNLREITEEMQKQVKEVVKATTGVEVLEVNIKVKNVYSKNKKAEQTEAVPIFNQALLKEKEMLQNQVLVEPAVSEKVVVEPVAEEVTVTEPVAEEVTVTEPVTTVENAAVVEVANKEEKVLEEETSETKEKKEEVVTEK